MIRGNSCRRFLPGSNRPGFRTAISTSRNSELWETTRLTALRHFVRRLLPAMLREVDASSFPPASSSTGAIHLKSNVDLHLAADATIKFSPDPKQYLPLVFTRWEGTELMNYSPFIYAFEQENIAVTGEGTLDGQAGLEHWWRWNGRKNWGWKEGEPSAAKARNLLHEMAENGTPVSEREFGEGSYLRPQFIQPYRCKNVLIEGITIKNSPMWEVHPVLCTNVTVRKLTINSTGPNNDGCDPESCADVLIEDCSFNTGDDCIAIKSGRNADGRRLHAPSQKHRYPGLPHAGWSRRSDAGQRDLRRRPQCVC